MYTASAWSIRYTLSTALAAAIVAVSGLAFEYGHAGPAPRGIVEVGALVAVDVLPRVAVLPEVIVIAKRLHTTEPKAGA